MTTLEEAEARYINASAAISHTFDPTDEQWDELDAAAAAYYAAKEAAHHEEAATLHAERIREEGHNLGLTPEETEAAAKREETARLYFTNDCFPMKRKGDDFRRR